MPLVLLDGVPENGDEPVDSVIPDEAGGAYAAVRHLVHAGHRRIALCNVSDETYIASRLRREGYERALREAGIEPDPALAVEVPLAETPAAVPAARALLDRAEPPTAVFCFADKLAFAFYQVAHQLGMSVPEDLSVVGFDNQPYLAEALLPGLTTVQLPHYDMGTWAAGRARLRQTTRLSARPRGTTTTSPGAVVPTDPTNVASHGAIESETPPQQGGSRRCLP
jgi:LacI family transcriptional regulator